jgi:hypothetical protein
MNNPITEQELSALIKKSLDDSLLQMDASIVNRLHMARRQALLPAKQTRHKVQWTGAFAVSLVLILLFWHGHAKQDFQPDDLFADELVMTEDNQELIMDLDFYNWLENSQNQG